MDISVEEPARTGAIQSLSWRAVCTHLKTRIPQDAFQRWFSAARLMDQAEDGVTVAVPNAIYQIWIESNFMPQLQEAVVSVAQRPMSVRFAIESVALQGELASAAEPVRPEPVIEVEELAHPSKSGINPRYTFDGYVVGSNNELAAAASRAVAGSPGRTYNPLFIHGRVGLGKTHLLHAVGNEVMARRKNCKVFYITSEQFTNEFIDALQNSSLGKFRKRFRSLDVLMIDDIHFLSGKERSQEEFFHTFNCLFDGHKQIILTSDRPTSEIAQLQERLVSRFDWGMTAELMPPDVETRIAILRKKMAAMRVEIPSEVITYLATHIRTNVRRLEGALTRVATIASLAGKELTIPMIEPYLRDLLQEEIRRSVTVDQIQKCVADVYDLRQSDMVSKKRPAHIAQPRMIAMYLSRKLTQNTLSDIGASFGNRDHGTVMHACKQINERIISDDKLRQIVLHLEQQLQRD